MPASGEIWLRGRDLNPRPSGYEPDELPGCSTPHFEDSLDVDSVQIENPAEHRWLAFAFAVTAPSLMRGKKDPWQNPYRHGQLV
jgi:hypothetical protein